MSRLFTYIGYFTLATAHIEGHSLSVSFFFSIVFAVIGVCSPTSTPTPEKSEYHKIEHAWLNISLVSFKIICNELFKNN